MTADLYVTIQVHYKDLSRIRVALRLYIDALDMARQTLDPLSTDRLTHIEEWREAGALLDHLNRAG